MTSVSCLVISKSYNLLNNMLTSLEGARQEWSTFDEVLCSWNGSEEDESRIIKGRKPRFRVSQREPYHFAKNINSLAKMAKGDYILIINDDVILDKGCIDKSLKILEGNKNIGIVGGLLRSSDDTLSHAGILFNYDLLPYNRCRPELGAHIRLESNEVNRSGEITGITGALMIMSKVDFLKVLMRETFSNCCEDIALCLDFLAKIYKVTYFSSDVTAIHNEKSTRGDTDDTKDYERLKAIFKVYKASLPQMWLMNTVWQVHEAEWLKDICTEKIVRIYDQSNEIKEIRKNLERTKRSWELDRELLINGQKELEKGINELHASMSWRITKPMRYIMSHIRKLRRQ